MKRIEFTTDQVQEIASLYHDQMSIKEVGRKLGYSRNTITRVLDEYNIEKRSNEQARRLGRGIKDFREDAFNILTPDTLYWIGFLYADGHINKEGRDGNNVSVNLAEKDIDHLKKFNEFLGGGCTIRDVTSKNIDKVMSSLPGRKTFEGKMFRLAFNCTKIHTRLKDLGFMHNKTYNLTPHPALKWSRDFWRGVLDGDGWLSMIRVNRIYNSYKTPNIGLCGSKETVEGFIEFLNISGINCGSTAKKKKREVWAMNATNSMAMKIADLLYKDSTTYLTRKYQKYQEFTLDKPIVEEILAQEPNSPYLSTELTNNLCHK